MKQLHTIQLEILKKLLFTPSLRYTDIKPDKKMDNNQFDFHLDKMVEAGYIEKLEMEYTLTPIGKEYANRLDTDEVTIEKQAKLSVAITCVKEEKGVKKYLIQQRLKQPFYGYYGFMTGKIRLGETVLETAQRELQEETGLEADLRLVKIKHKMDYSEDNKILEDKFLFGMRGDNPRGDLIEEVEGGKNLWLTKEEIRALPKKFDGLMEAVDLYDSPHLAFQEGKYVVEEF